MKRSKIKDSELVPGLDGMNKQIKNGKIVLIVPKKPLVGKPRTATATIQKKDN